MTKLHKQVDLDLVAPYLIYKYVMNEEPSAKTYDDRLIWQKVGYLAKEVGISLNEYHFNWYLAGPYSPSFTSILFNINESFDAVWNEARSYSLSEIAQNKLKKIKSLLDDIPDGIQISKWLELLASIIYIEKEYGLGKEKSIKKLKRLKPFFNNSMMNSYAWELLDKQNML